MGSLIQQLKNEFCIALIILRAGIERHLSGAQGGEPLGGALKLTFHTEAVSPLIGLSPELRIATEDDYNSRKLKRCMVMHYHCDYFVLTHHRLPPMVVVLDPVPRIASCK